MRRVVAVILLASATGAGAQEPRNGPEWGGKDHQPTQAEVSQREKQAGMRAPAAQADKDQRTVDQLGQQLLHEEGVDPPRPAAPR